MKRVLTATTLLLIFFLGLGTEIYSQDYQTTYIQGKQYMSEGNYALAAEYFKKVSSEGNKSLPFYEYASFYFGLAAYKNNDLALARSLWLQQLIKSPTWDKIEEVHYWLAQVYFDEQNYEKGVYYAKQANFPNALGLVHHYLQNINQLDVLKSLHSKYPNDILIGQVYARKLSEQPWASHDLQSLSNLVQRFDFEPSDYGFPPLSASPHKESYNVAVLLPFFFDGLDQTGKVERNKFIMSLYQGILMAVDTLTSQGVKLNIFAYDTKRNAEITTEIMSKPEMKSMDLLIGPLFPEPSQIVNEFSFSHKINMINPLVSNGQSIANNPYAFLFRNSTEAKARAAAQVVIARVENKNAMVFYEKNTRNQKDSISAYIYSEVLKNAGFNVLLNMGLVDATLVDIYNMLTEKYEVRYTADQLNALVSADKVIKTRKSVIVKDSIEYYEERFVLKKDSIGHVYVASSNPVFASHFVSAFTMRDEHTQLIGNSAWQKIETLTLAEMEHLGLFFIDDKYLKKESSTYKQFSNSYLNTFRTIPSFNVAIGYEMMYYLGKMLQSFGRYFQSGNVAVGFQEGQLMQGIDFGAYNSNQYIPITTFENARLKVVNPK